MQAFETLFKTADSDEAGEQFVDELVQVLDRFEEQRLRPLVDEARRLGFDAKADAILAAFRRRVAHWAQAIEG